MKLFGFLLILISLAGCQTADRRPQSVAGSNDELVADLTREISERVHTLGRPVKAYHYGRRSPALLNLKRGTVPEEFYTSPVELEPREAKDYFREWSGQFGTGKTDDNSLSGPGLYAGIDPVQSEGYAKGSWFLMELIVPVGTKYLEARPGQGGIYLSDDFLKKWFPNQRFSYLYRVGDRTQFSFKKFSEIRSDFPSSLATVFRNLHIDFVMYGWADSAFPICRNKTAWGAAAFNFINPEFVDRAPAPKIYVANLEEDPSSKKRKAYANLYRQIANAPLDLYLHRIPTSNGEDRFKIRWRSLELPVRLQTRAWATRFHEDTVFDRILEDPAALDALHQAEDTVWTPLSAQTVKLVPISGRLQDQTPFVYDPLAEGGTPIGGTREEINEQLKSQTFGCSEKYPDENAFPRE